MESKEAVMPLTGHLSELRRRLIISIVMLAVGMILSNFWLDEIMAFLSAPAGKLYFMKPAEAFFIYFKVMLTAGAIITAPVLFYEFWAFLVPAFTTHEKRLLFFLVPTSLMLFLSGIAFSWFIVLPRGLQFFLNFSSDAVQPLLSMESYLNFVFMLVLPFGLIFNLPLVLIVLAKLGLISSDMLAKSGNTSFSYPCSRCRHHADDGHFIAVPLGHAHDRPLRNKPADHQIRPAHLTAPPPQTALTRQSFFMVY